MGFFAVTGPIAFRIASSNMSSGTLLHACNTSLRLFPFSKHMKSAKCFFVLPACCWKLWAEIAYVIDTKSNFYTSRNKKVYELEQSETKILTLEPLQEEQKHNIFVPLITPWSTGCCVPRKPIFVRIVWLINAIKRVRLWAEKTNIEDNEVTFNIHNSQLKF